MSLRILLLPSVAKGNGSGHLVRCLALARSLGPGATIYVEDSPSSASWSAAELSLSYSRELAGLSLVTELNPGQGWDLIILDRRRSSLEEVQAWERLGPVLALDEGGPGRSMASYLIDVLPRPPHRFLAPRAEAPNLSRLAFLDLPLNRRPAPEAFRRVLVSFGGEDPAGLAVLLARSLLAWGLFKPENLTIVSGALRRGGPPLGLEGVTLLGPVQDLKEHLVRYDLVFTQFGLTAYEAAYAGCGVILLNPSAYHRALSLAAGFPEIGVQRPRAAALKRLLKDVAGTLEATRALAPAEASSLSAHIKNLSPTGSRGCPRCRRGPRSSVYRDEGKTYFRCHTCGLVYLERFSSGREAPYREAYFFDEYKAQYGKTYLEDWPALTAFANTRLGLIEDVASRSLGRKEGLSLLDIGCAYGPFVAAARSRGQEPYGLDIAEDAARYVRDSLGIPAASGDFLDPAVAAAFGGPFDVVSMWYVIEHFDDLDRALRNVAALVRPGGVFAFATPSGEGISARTNRPGFLSRSPADHFSIWEPSKVRGILKPYGFRVERIRITGHHPERFPLLGGRASARNPVYRLLGLLSRLLGLGDTFEVYAVKEPMPADPVLDKESREGKHRARQA